MPVDGGKAICSAVIFYGDWQRHAPCVAAIGSGENANFLRIGAQGWERLTSPALVSRPSPEYFRGHGSH